MDIQWLCHGPIKFNVFVILQRDETIATIQSYW